jgi:hypothetical protein
MTAAKVWFGLMLLSSGLSIYFFRHPVSFNTLTPIVTAPAAHVSPPPPTTQVPTPASIPVVAPGMPSPTMSGVRLVMINPSVSALGPNKWRIELPADMEYDTGIPVTANQVVKTSGWSGLVKLDPAETFVNRPAGTLSPKTPGLKTARAESFINDEAWIGALLGRVSLQPNTYDIGGREEAGLQHNSFVASTDGTFVALVNCLQNEKHNATGGYTFIVEVQ